MPRNIYFSNVFNIFGCTVTVANNIDPDCFDSQSKDNFVFFTVFTSEQDLVYLLLTKELNYLLLYLSFRRRY